MKLYIRASENVPYIDGYTICDGRASRDTVLPNSFYLEAYTTDGDTIWIGKSSEPEYNGEYSLSTASSGDEFSSSGDEFSSMSLREVIEYFGEHYSMDDETAFAIVSFAKEYMWGYLNETLYQS